MFPEGEFDDQVDALVYTLLFLFGLLVGEENRKTETAEAQAVGRERWVIS